MIGKRIIYLDIIRIVSCILIVLMHSPHPDAGNPNYVVVPIYFITAAGLCLFFMVSGALLLPVKTETFSFLKRRIGKVIFPLVFWSLFYLAVKLITHEITWDNSLHAVMSIPFSRQGHGVLWFMYVLIGLYLLAPIITPFLQREIKKELEFYLFLWGITLCYPLLDPFVDLTVDSYGILYYFTGFSGYFIFGYYLHTYCKSARKMVLMLLFVLPFMSFGAFQYFGIHKAFSDLFWYEGLAVAVLCVAIFMTIRMIVVNHKIRNDWSKLLITLSNCTFGVYLMHIFIMNQLFHKSDFVVHEIGGLGQIVITWVGTLVISFTLVFAISFLPYSEYIIGFTNRRKK